MAFSTLALTRIGSLILSLTELVYLSGLSSTSRPHPRTVGTQLNRVLSVTPPRYLLARALAQQSAPPLLYTSPPRRGTRLLQLRRKQTWVPSGGVPLPV
ncbi:hypothetical protein BC826DRAFT_165681 [Russula brevipes]|nr:hypothetical protein BC826DRAFT_165681 [Russula brevipes]